MKIRQINVVLENTAGRLYDMTALLHKADIDLRSLFVTEDTEFSAVHIIVNKPDAAFAALKAAGYFVTEVEVFALKAEDKPGGLMKILDVLRANELNIEYVYGFGEKSDNQAVFIFRITQIDKALEVLHSGAVGYLTPDKIEGRKRGSSWELVESL